MGQDAVHASVQKHMSVYVSITWGEKIKKKKLRPYGIKISSRNVIRLSILIIKLLYKITK